MSFSNSGTQKTYSYLCYKMHSYDKLIAWVCVEDAYESNTEIQNANGLT